MTNAPHGPVAGRSGGEDDNHASSPSLRHSYPVYPALLHGTPAEIESWLRGLDRGRRWYPHAACGLCRRELERAA